MPVEPTKKVDEFDLDVQFHVATDRAPDLGEIQGSQFSIWASCISYTGCDSMWCGGGGGGGGGSGSHCMCVE